MICNICGVNEATIHLTEIVNDQMVEIHLCETCAEEKGTDFKTHFNFGELVSGLSIEGVDESDPSGKTKGIGECPSCHMTYDDFGNAGRLGCPECYQAFSVLLIPLIKRLQRSAHHAGKRPGRQPTRPEGTNEILQLQDRLRQCVTNEAFEEAARLRDSIKKLEKSQKEQKQSDE